MIRLIEALNYRCLRYVHQPLDRFHILVGPNASGKTTFLDVLSFLGKMVSDGLERAIEDRTADFRDLVWGREGHSFELAIEAEIPQLRRRQLHKSDYDVLRYEVRVGLDETSEAPAILEERASLKRLEAVPRGPLLFPIEPSAPDTIMAQRRKDQRTVLSKTEGSDHFYSEVETESGKGWYPSVRLGPSKSVLGNLHEDESKFPVCTWFKALLSEGVENLVLNSMELRKASPPLLRRGFKPDGSNLPWVIRSLREACPPKFNEWIQHLQTALPGIRDVKTVVREDDRHCYLKLCYAHDLEVPSWMTSDGTLRLLALTLPAYREGIGGIYLVEEPENGIHPSAMEAVFHSLSSVYDAQVLLATHSTVLLSLARPEQVLCFKQTKSGATDIVRGDQHPALRDWRGRPNLDVLFASGVLG